MSRVLEMLVPLAFSAAGLVNFCSGNTWEGLAFMGLSEVAGIGIYIRRIATRVEAD